MLWWELAIAACARLVLLPLVVSDCDPLCGGTFMQVPLALKNHHLDGLQACSPDSQCSASPRMSYQVLVQGSGLVHAISLPDLALSNVNGNDE